MMAWDRPHKAAAPPVEPVPGLAVFRVVWPDVVGLQQRDQASDERAQVLRQA